MKLKYYLRGLGVGIVCTAIIMGIATSGKGKEKLTDAEIIERARLLGMVMAEDKEETEEPEDNEQNPEQAEEGTPEENQNDAPPVNPPAEGEQVVPEEPPVTEPEIKTIEVLPGDYSDVVSQKLFEAGLIEDAAAFNEYLMNTGADQNIMVGVHQIPMGATQDEIIQILGEKAE